VNSSRGRISDPGWLPENSAARLPGARPKTTGCKAVTGQGHPSKCERFFFEAVCHGTGMALSQASHPRGEVFAESAVAARFRTLDCLSVDLSGAAFGAAQ